MRATTSWRWSSPGCPTAAFTPAPGATGRNMTRRSPPAKNPGRGDPFQLGSWRDSQRQEDPDRRTLGPPEHRLLDRRRSSARGSGADPHELRPDDDDYPDDREEAR